MDEHETRAADTDSISNHYGTKRLKDGDLILGKVAAMDKAKETYTKDVINYSEKENKSVEGQINNSIYSSKSKSIDAMKKLSLPINAEHTINHVTHTPKLKKVGILRNTVSEPIIISTPSNSPKVSPKHSSVFSKNSKKLSFSQAYGKYTKRSSQEFTNPAFEPDDQSLSDDIRLADIVDQVLRQPLDGRYVHPFGQGNLYKAILVGDKTKVQHSTGKLFFWAVFVVLLVGIACTIILLAETYDGDKYIPSNSTPNATVGR